MKHTKKCLEGTEQCECTINMESKEPIFDDIYCMPECPFFEQYTHPYYAVSAWCFKLMKELGYYDYYIAACQEDENEK